MRSEKNCHERKMIMINFINFVFSLKSKHENKKQYGNHTPSLGNPFCFPEK